MCAMKKPSDMILSDDYFASGDGRLKALLFHCGNKISIQNAGFAGDNGSLGLQVNSNSRHTGHSTEHLLD